MGKRKAEEVPVYLVRSPGVSEPVHRAIVAALAGVDPEPGDLAELVAELEREPEPGWSPWGSGGCVRGPQ